MMNGIDGASAQPKAPARQRLGFDELAELVKMAARARAYPDDLSSIAAEMTLWCERHRLPGPAAMADHLEKLVRFDRETADPKPQKDGTVRFADPVLGGMFVHHHYDDFQWPALIEGPATGAILFPAFLALGAHQRGDRLSIAFLGTEDRPAEAARFLYGEGRSLLEGDADVARLSRRIAVEKLAGEGPLLDEPLAQSVPCGTDVLRRLRIDRGRLRGAQDRKQ